MFCSRCREPIAKSSDELCPNCMAELGITASEPAAPEPDEPSAASPDEPSVASPEPLAAEPAEPAAPPPPTRPPADVSAVSEAAAPADDGLLIVHGAVDEAAALENQADQMEGVSTGPAEDPEPADDPEPSIIEPSYADQAEAAATAPDPDPTPVDELAPQMIEASFGDQLDTMDHLETMEIPLGPDPMPADDPDAQLVEPPFADQLESVATEPAPAVRPTLPHTIADQLEAVPTPSGAGPDPPKSKPRERAIQSEVEKLDSVPAPKKKPPGRRPAAPRRKSVGVRLLRAVLLIVVLAAVGAGGYYAGTGKLPPVLAQFPVLTRLLELAPAASADSVLLILAIDASDATLWINDEFVNRRRHELLAGEYRLRVVAPGYQPYETTLALSPGDTLEYSVPLQPIPQCDGPQTVGYNLDALCFDESPRLVGSVRFAVPLGPTMTRRPSTPATLVIEVLTDGSPGTVIVKDPSDVPEFTITAVEFAKGLAYEPAQKNGSAVVGWVELEFYAGRLGS